MKDYTKNIWKDEYLDYNNNYKRLPIGFIYEGVFFENYESCQISDTESIYIKVSLPLVNYNRNIYIKSSHKFIMSDDTQLMVRLLSLRHQLSHDLFERFRPIGNLLNWQGIKWKNDYALEHRIINTMADDDIQIFNKKFQPDLTVEQEDIDLIINWCKKYGFPYSIHNYLNSDPRLENIINESTKKAYRVKKTLVSNNTPIYVYFDLWGFLLQLHILHSTFMLFNRLNKTKITNFVNEFNNFSDVQCNELLEKIYSRINVRTKLKFDNQHTFKLNNMLSFTTDNIFDLTLYSLYLFRASVGKKIGYCPICKNVFIKKRGNQIYCKTKPCDVDRCDNNCNKFEFEECKKITCYPQLNYKRTH